MELLRWNLNAWEATTVAYRERSSGKWACVLTAWDKGTDTWKVCAKR